CARRGRLMSRHSLSHPASARPRAEESPPRGTPPFMAKTPTATPWFDRARRLGGVLPGPVPGRRAEWGSSLRARWPWPRVGLLLVIAVAMWAIKRHYATADVGDLVWILKPVASLCAVLGGAEFEWEPGSGYLSREYLFVIAKPCAGVNFMLAALGMVGLLLSERALSWRASA